MLKVGITGGIGSGKSTVCAFFEVLGIPVFYADEAARTMMDSDAHLRAGIADLFGPGIYVSGRLDRTALSQAVFGFPERLAALNALVHPATIAAAERWMQAQRSPYVIKEAAIFFESGSNVGMDIMIGVRAPRELRMQRAMNRGLSREDVSARMSRQMDEEEKMRRCDYVIANDDVQAVIPQVLHLDDLLRKEAIRLRR
jgi:dephospho-CoA kinase